jgi:hypothetical protein
VVACLGDFVFLAAVLFGVGVYDESTIKTFVNMSFEGNGMAVIEMTAERFGVKLIGEGFSR